MPTELNEDYRDPKDLGIPDLKDADLSKVASNTASEPEQKEVKEVDSDQALTEDASDKEFKNPHARARYLEKQLEQEKTDSEILARRLQWVLESVPEMVAKSVAPQKEEPAEEVDLDPITVILKKIDGLGNKLNEIENKSVTQTQVSADMQALSLANKVISDAVNASPEFSGAITHLAKIVLFDLNEKFPNLTKSEKEKIADRAIQQEKVDIVKSGKNPVDVFYKRALLMGFRPEEVQTQTKKEKDTQPEKPQKDPRAQIKKENERDSKMNSIGGAPSTGARGRAGIKELASMNNAEFEDYVNSGIKDGTFKLEPGRRNPRFSELMRGYENPRGR